MKKNEKIILAIVILLLIVLAFLFLKHRGEQAGEQAEVPVPHKAKNGPCPGETKVLTQDDVYMRGLLEKGQKFKVIMNYFDCNAPQKGDLVLYSLSSNLPPVVKIVRGVEGDSFKMVVDKKYHAWDIIINGDKIWSVIDKEQPYFVGIDTSPPTLSLYEKPRNGVLKKDEVILLSSFPPGDKDSGIFGVSSLTDVLGKVEPIEGTGTK